MNKNPGRYFQEVKRIFYYYASTKAEQLSSVMSMRVFPLISNTSYELQKVWVDTKGILRGHRNGKPSFTLVPFTLETLSLLQFHSQSIILNITSPDFYHFLYSCTGKVRARMPDPVFQRNLYLRFLGTLLLGYLNCWVLIPGLPPNTSIC